MVLDLVRVPPSGTWDRRRADVYALADRWAPRPTAGPADSGDSGEACYRALEHVARRYLGAFGPAHPRDIATWAGLKVGDMTRAVARTPLRRFSDEGGGVLVDLPRAALPKAGTPAPVRFLGTWDALLLTHARRTQVLPERHRARIFTSSNPFSLGTVLVDGSVAATWRFSDGVVTVSELDELTSSDRAQVRDEALRLQEFHLTGGPTTSASPTCR